MTRLWDKGVPLDARVLEYTAGEDYALDERLVAYDVRASIAHAEMLQAQGLLSAPDLERICEGLGATEANYGLTNVDNKIGSVGRVPYPERSNIRVVRYDVESGAYLRDPEGSLVLCKPGEVGELIAEVLEGPGAAGFFEGYTSPEATEAKLLRNAFRSGDRWVRSGDLVRHDADDYY